MRRTTGGYPRHRQRDSQTPPSMHTARFLVYENSYIAAFRSLSILYGLHPHVSPSIACRTTVLHMVSVQSFLNRFAFLATFRARAADRLHDTIGGIIAKVGERSA